MKILHVFLLFLIIGCSSNQIKIEANYEKADSILQSNKTTVAKSDSIDRRSEKVITKKITQTVNKINKLEREVVEAKNALEYAKKNPKIIRVVDTIYVEKKKNFWGREKTSVTTKSDSTIVSDTTFQNQ
jgi:hypothetical protein